MDERRGQCARLKAMLHAHKSGPRGHKGKHAANQSKPPGQQQHARGQLVGLQASCKCLVGQMEEHIGALIAYVGAP
eukprot:656465-Pelagomonas_calceolata.AAC.1